jgi:hypothetical protein
MIIQKKEAGGPRVVLKHKHEPVYLIYAHLDREIVCKIDDILKSGQIFAKIGKPPFNGNWFPHVHVQTVKEEYFEYLIKNDLWPELDGYGALEDLKLHVERFPDPIQYISII